MKEENEKERARERGVEGKENKPPQVILASRLGFGRVRIGSRAQLGERRHATESIGQTMAGWHSAADWMPLCSAKVPQLCV